MAFFREKRLRHDDPRTQAVDANFRSNLEAIRRTARQAGSELILATALEDFGQGTAAREQQEEAVRLMPWSARLRVELALSPFHENRNRDAALQLEEALRLDPTHPGAREGWEGDPRQDRALNGGGAGRPGDYGYLWER